MLSLLVVKQHLREDFLVGSRVNQPDNRADGSQAPRGRPGSDRCWDWNDPTDASQSLVRSRDLTRYRDQPDKSLHQSVAAMHHRPRDQERALSLSILAMCWPSNIPRVESN